MKIINYGDHSCDLGFRVGLGTSFLSLFLLEKIYTDQKAAAIEFCSSYLIEGIKMCTSIPT